MPRTFSQAKARVGLRDVAAAAKVCVMTVSLALRDNPRISITTRDRIKRLANQLGYHPDPELSRLMNHLRASRTARGKVGVALIDFYPTATYAENAYNQKLRQGAVRRAQELGFTTTALHAADYNFNLQNLVKVIRTRGLEGAMLMPGLVPMALDPDVNWNGISVLATSKSILAPRFHCVLPNQFGNMMMVIESLQARGARRICAVFDEFFDERTARNFTAAVSRQGQADLSLVLPQQLNAEQRAAAVVSWIARHRPDAIFAQADAVGRALSRLAAIRPRLEFQIVGLGAHNSSGFSYLDECADVIGSGAIDLLAGMMYYHETGIPNQPRTTLTDGKLVFSPKLVNPFTAAALRVNGN